ncbi:preprotein translocase subunit SecD [Cellulosimicrobium cellulans]|uniref:Protein translocase subunit SecD n=1 Tax=Cellulosimicrobium cellulans TaxID=1710 RepID=A0A1Y0HYE7_CELCE|nr:protein translocase subunit SecD [Cellulosimicrobium cellulans]ARU53049.1 protein translocase subunit SecD [Cellulosimicrobium cellulans]MBM7819821.1 preprotein translocase subunit SecD [Cellulosimicrobium cellulans]
MANSSTRRSRPVRTIVLFLLLSVVLFGALFAGTKVDGRSADNPGGASFAPALALDLEGGTQIVLQPVTEDASAVTPETINQAINVIRQRIDAQGVSETEITSQGRDKIVVGIPGQPSQETIDLVSASAQMRFRPVLTVGMPTATPAEDATGDEAATEESADPATESADPATDDATDPAADGATDPAADAATDAPADDATTGTDTETTRPENPSDLAQITPELQAEFDALDCTLPENQVGGDSGPTDAAFVSCADDGSAKYILGPVEIEGTDISNANSGLRVGQNGVVTNEWVVNLEFDSEGTKEFRDVTTRLTSLPAPQNQFAMVLDGLVISAPVSQAVIPDGKAEISGSFTRDSAATLANQLNFGALPLTFEVQSQEQISATLGSEQLQKGLIAGVIGLLLVFIYSLFQYRMLGFLTIASLIVAGVVTYLTIALMSWGIGYRLSLAGVAGLIVAIGFTADSFIVYFERIRDELRDGRTLQQAVSKGWARARRTILAAKAVNLISAVVLYFLAVGGVQGFAVTLGLTTIIDVAVVFWFTHPVMELVARVPFFRDGHKWSGLSPDRLQTRGPRYVGAGKVVGPGQPADRRDAPVAEQEPAGAKGEDELVLAGSAPRTPAHAEDGRRLTIAERRAAERRAAAAQEPAPGGTDGPADAAPSAIDGENEENR